MAVQKSKVTRSRRGMRRSLCVFFFLYFNINNDLLKLTPRKSDPSPHVYPIDEPLEQLDH